MNEPRSFSAKYPQEEVEEVEEVAEVVPALIQVREAPLVRPPSL